MVEVPVDLKARRRDFLGRPRLFDHVVLFGRVHLEDGVAFLSGALDFAGKVLGGCGPGPRRHGHAVADLLAQQLVRRFFDGLAHRVVQRTHQTGAERTSDVVERRLVDQARDLPFAQRGVAALVTVADDAIVEGYAKDGLGVDAGEANLVALVAVAKARVEVEEFDVGDFHGDLSTLRGMAASDAQDFAGVHQVVWVECFFDAAHDLDARAALGFERVELAQADAVFAGAGSPGLERPLDDLLA